MGGEEREHGLRGRRRMMGKLLWPRGGREMSVWGHGGRREAAEMGGFAGHENVDAGDDQ